MALLLFMFLLLAAAGPGCEKPAPAASSARPYGVCSWETTGEPCGRGPTVCTDGATQTFVGYCTQPCEADSDCVEAPDGSSAVCEQFYHGRLCAIPCQEDDECPAGNSCAHLVRANGNYVSLCQPEPE